MSDIKGVKLSVDDDNLGILIPMEQIRELVQSDVKGAPAEVSHSIPSTVYSYRMIFPPRGSKITVRPEVAVANWFFSLHEGKEASIRNPAHYFADAAFIDKVSDFQRRGDLKVDGTVGPETWKALSYFPDGGVMPPLCLRSQVVTAEIETGHVANTYGFNTGKDIGDGAGVNFGIVQHNSRGSLNKLLTDYAPVRIRQNWRTTKSIRDLSEWMGGAEGVAAQNEYYKNEIYDTALYSYRMLTEERNTVGVDYERFIALLCDIAVQNGIIYSPYRSVDGVGDESGNWAHFLGGRVHWASVKGEVSDLRVKFTANSIVNRKTLEFISSKVQDINDFMLGVAMYRARCSRKKYAARVEQRKLTIAAPKGYKGWQGEVHGKKMDMHANFGIGLELWS